MRPRSPGPVTKRRKNRRRLESKLTDELSIVSTGDDDDTQQYRDKDEVNKIERAPLQYDAKHLTEESCSQSGSIQEPMQMSSRGKQMVSPSRGNSYREHRERDSQGREDPLGHGI